MTLSTAYAAQLGSTVLSGLTNLDAQTNPEVDNEVGIGSIYPQFVVIRSINPKVLFNSRAAQATLSQTGSTGADITDANPFKATFARLAANGQPDNTAIHRTYTATRGLLLPKRLSCQHRQDARIDVETLLWSADGVAAPMVIADTGALPTVPRDNIRHTLQSATIGGVSFGCLESVDVDFGNNARTRGCSSNQYDSDMIQAGVQPVITLVGLNADVFKSESKAVLHASWAGLAVGADVPENGDAKPLEFLGIPLLLLRDKDGKEQVIDRKTGKLTAFDKPGVQPDLSATHKGHKPVLHHMAERYMSDEYAPENVAAKTGLTAKRIRQMAAELARVAFDEEITLDRTWTDFRGKTHDKMVGRPVSFHAMRGISAHSNGFQTCRALHT